MAGSPKKGVVYRTSTKKLIVREAKSGRIKTAGAVKPIKKNANVTLSSGNVFADLELPDADQLKVKSGLVMALRNVIAREGLTQVAAAKAMGVDQPKVSRLLNGDLYGFSTDQLMRFLTSLGEDVEIVVHGQAVQSKAKVVRGKLSIRAA